MLIGPIIHVDRRKTERERKRIRGERFHREESATIQYRH